VKHEKWEPWMKKGVIHGAIRGHQYLRITYTKKANNDWSVRFVVPKRVKDGKLWAEDVTPGKNPGFKYFIMDRITFAEALPENWTPLELAGIRSNDRALGEWRQKPRQRAARLLILLVVLVGIVLAIIYLVGQ